MDPEDPDIKRSVEKELGEVKKKLSECERQRLEQQGTSQDKGQASGDSSDSVMPKPKPFSDQMCPNEMPLIRQIVKMNDIKKLPSKIPYYTLSNESRRRKVYAYRRLIYRLAYCIAGGSYEDLIKEAIKRVVDKFWGTGLREQQIDLGLQHVADMYAVTYSKFGRDILLASVAPRNPDSKLMAYIPGLSHYACSRARRIARGFDFNPYMSLRTRNKYSQAKLTAFIQYLASPEITLEIGWGEKTVELQSGETLSVTTGLRLMSHTQIVNGFIKVMKDRGELYLVFAKSTMYHILREIPATKKRSMQCVDYIQADASEAVEILLEKLKDWYMLGEIDEDTKKDLHHRILELYAYLRTQFKQRIKLYSQISDHCALRALSDPINHHYRRNCYDAPNNMHNHKIRCDACEEVKTTLKMLETLVGKWVKEAQNDPVRLKDMLNRQTVVKRAIKKILEYKAHVVRAWYSEYERRELVASLTAGTAFVTCDYAQRWLAQYHRERQSDYYGKSGTSWHICHVLAKFDGYVDFLFEHSFIHIISGNAKQNSSAVTASIYDMALWVKPFGIKRLILRMDGAGYYRCTDTISTMPWISEQTGVEIIMLTHSETGTGKGSADRIAALVKRQVYYQIDQGKNAETPENFYERIKESEIKGITVQIGRIGGETNEGRKKTKSDQFDQISQLHNFEFSGKKVIARKWFKIGSGREYQPKNHNTGIFISERPKDTSSTTSRKIEDFWIMKGPFKDSPESDDDAMDTDSHPEDEAEEMERLSNEPETLDRKLWVGTILRCREPSCSATFINPKARHNHEIKGKHKIIPDRVGLIDKAIGIYNEKLEKFDARPNQDFMGTIINDVLISEGQDADEGLPVGWALTKRENVRILPAVKAILDELYNAYLNDKSKKVTGAQALAQLREKKDASDLPLFTEEELPRKITTDEEHQLALEAEHPEGDPELEAVEEDDLYDTLETQLMDDVMEKKDLIFKKDVRE
ncbi:hypothetical protein WR25_23886 [Diploscapter pachys]|uniref:C2H2-type domain-containing protein n=1 Tax=Diploscapter pachys TaxID=2018661 RepID=A0A2A2KEW4_9BILA|nr:hypothetical protein WR25_23886 [Diploscapter pachys]